MSTVLSVLAALLLISVIVTVHEFGHYFVGRKFGFTILEFAVGMGPVILKKRKNEIDYTLRALPIGGMCRFYGEESGETDQRSFSAHPAWKKLLVIAAGPLMNLLFALILSIVTLISYGNYMPSVVELAGADQPAAVAGMEPGDVITAIGGKTVYEYTDAIPMILAADGSPLDITVERNGIPIECVVVEYFNEDLGRNQIGITISPVRMRFGFLKSTAESIHYIGGVIGQIFDFFGTIFQGKATTGDVAGPVGTIAYVSQAVRYGFEMILRFAILISISLGVFNLLPIPALDGGRLVFLLFEAITGKKVDPEKEGMVHFIGLIALFALIIFLTYSDILKLIGR